MKDICVNYFPLRRWYYWPAVLGQFVQIKPENKRRLHVQVFRGAYNADAMVAYLRAHGISASIPLTQAYSYHKLVSYNYRTQYCFNSGYRYSIKLDEDIFVLR